MNKPKLFISFSGGRTSAFMTKWLLDNKQDEYEMIVLFANTGQEHEKTLEFVDRCDKVLGFDVIWIEAVVAHGQRKQTGHRVVTFETASRKGEPFEEVIIKYGIPNKSRPLCTKELKLRPMQSYLKSIGWKDYYTAIGIRADEQRRVSKSAEARRVIYPLIDMVPMDKRDVLDWWEEQDFDLDLLEHQGNCTWCWKKSLRKHVMLINESPEIYDFPRRMEKLHGLAGPCPNGIPHVFFRENRSTDQLFALAAEANNVREFQIPFDFCADGGCSESCEVFATEVPA